MSPRRGLYAVTDGEDRPLGELVARVEQVLLGGAVLVQYREKTGDTRRRRREGAALLELCRARGVPLIVNDDARLARALGADGVHLGRDDLAVAEARNRRRLEERMMKLAKRVGFRVGPGLRDRVIYRELFPFGLTVADLSNEVRPVAVSLAHVAARQEMRNLMMAMGLEQVLNPLDVAA